MADTDSTVVETHPDDKFLAPGSICPECGAAGDLEGTWCRQCGFYPKLGRCLDLDNAWENGVEDDSEPVSFFESIPPWAYKMLGLLVTTAAASLIARLVLQSRPQLHEAWSLTQLFTGFVVFALIHVALFVSRVLSDSGMKLLDLLNPWAVWSPVFRELPKAEKRLLTAWTGLWAAAFAVLIVGGLPLGWLNSRTELAKTAEAEEPGGRPGGGTATGELTDAIEDFAEQGSKHVGMPGDEVGLGVKTDVAQDVMEEPEEELEMECLIVGYIPRSPQPAGADQDAAASGADEASGEESGEPAADGETDDETAGDGDGPPTEPQPAIRALVVASDVHGRLAIVAYVSDGLTAGVCDELLEQFEGHQQDEPTVRCPVEGVWLKPKFICRVLYKEWDDSVGLLEPAFDELVQVLPLP